MRGNSLGNSSDASDSVIEAVASREGIDPVELTAPLYDAVDPEQLDRLLGSAASAVSVTFTYLGYEVTVQSDGSVTLAD